MTSGPLPSDPFRNVLVVDIETTGLDPYVHGIVEIGAVFLSDPRQKFQTHVRLRDDAEWTEGAYAVNGVTEGAARAMDRPSQERAVVTFADWIRQHRPGTRLILAGMNPRFDLDFLRAADPTGMGQIFSHRTLDLHTLAVAAVAREQPEQDITRIHTDAIYEFLGMAPEPRPHAALVGATWEYMAFQKILA